MSNDNSSFNPQLRDRIYILVRKDLPSMEQICVQSAHAALESGLHFGNKSDVVYTLSLLEIKDEKELFEWTKNLALSGIRFKVFREDDYPEGGCFTALATEPISRAEGKIFKKLSLLKFS